MEKDKDIVLLNIGTKEKPHNVWMNYEEYKSQKKWGEVMGRIQDTRMFYGVEPSDETKTRWFAEAGFEYTPPDKSPRGDTYWIVTNRGLMRKSRVDGSVYEVDQNYEPLLTPYLGEYQFIRDATGFDL